MPPVVQLHIDIATLIENSGLGIAEIARRAGVSYFNVYNLVRFPDRDTYSMTVLGSVLKVLGVKVASPFTYLPLGEEDE